MKNLLIVLIFLVLSVQADEWNLDIEPETPKEEGYYMMVRPCLKHLAYLQSKVSLLPEDVHYQYLEDWLGEEMEEGATEIAKVLREGERVYTDTSWSQRVLRWGSFQTQCQKDMAIMFRERLMDAAESIDPAGNLVR